MEQNGISRSISNPGYLPLCSTGRLIAVRMGCSLSIEAEMQGSYQKLTAERYIRSLPFEMGFHVYPKLPYFAEPSPKLIPYNHIFS